MTRDSILAFAAAGLLALPVAAAAAPPAAAAPAPAAKAADAPAATHRMINDADLKWSPAAALPPGGEVAIVDGDPTQPGMFVMRFRAAGPFRIPPHWHPADEHATVLSGSLWMGGGDKIDESAAHEIKTGGFSVMPKGFHHYAFTRGPAVVQVHGMGPWGITYVNPADDPRTAPATAAAPKR